MNQKQPTRCAWVHLHSKLSTKYHDAEWGVPVYKDRKLFEFIVLESAQAGLSWEIILKKRAGYRKAFRNFNPNKVAQMKSPDVAKLLTDTSIIRNRLKIEATIHNAKRFLEVQKEFGTFAEYMWQWTNKKQIQNRRKYLREIPSQTELSIRMAKDLKRRGFKFLGPTVWYAHMQAVGMVNDHTTDCYRHADIRRMASVVNN